jgi:cell division septal protein FtsQ
VPCALHSAWRNKRKEKKKERKEGKKEMKRKERKKERQRQTNQRTKQLCYLAAFCYFGFLLFTALFLILVED